MKKPRKITPAQFRKQFEAIKRSISDERDKLQELVNDAGDIIENCDDAINSIDEAADALSKYL